MSDLPVHCSGDTEHDYAELCGFINYMPEKEGVNVVASEQNGTE